MKKHIYNKVYGAAMLTALLLAAACTNEMPLADNNGQDPDNAKPEAGTLTTVTASQDAGAQTRLTYTDTGTTMNVAWKAGDVIYIGTKPGEKPGDTVLTPAEAGFKKFVCETINGNQATFKAAPGQELTGISAGTRLYAFYANEDNSYIYYDNPINYFFVSALTKQDGTSGSPSTFSSQRQITNNNKEHIGNYDFMYATIDYQENQTPSFSFEHGVSLIKFILQMPQDAANKYMKKLEFINKGVNSVFASSFGLISLRAIGRGLLPSSPPMTLLLGENESGFLCDTSTGTPMLTAYLVYDAISNNTGITVKVTDTENSTYSTTLTSNEVKRGKFYIAELKLVKD